MDADGSRRYEQSSYSSARSFAPGSSRAGSGSSASERFRQTHVQMPPTPTSAVGPSAGSRSQGSGSYGYTQGQQQYAPQMQDTLQYRSEYPQDAPRQQQFGPYSSNLIYSLPSSLQQQPAEYEVQQFQPRQTAAIEVLSNQFNVPPYYNAAEATSGAGSSQQSYASASYQQHSQYPQSAQNRSSNSSPYTAGITDYPQMSMSNVLEQPESSQQGRRSSGDDAYAGYMESLKQTFRETQQGRLVDAGRRLLQLSEWIAGQANELGLTRDEPGLHEERLKFWNDFNTCWLSVLQKQKETTQNMIDNGQPLHAGQSLLQEDILERMGRELVRMCDGLERHGLVDYQMGVWEEEIMNVLLECIQLLEGDEEPSASDAPETLPPLTRPPR